MSQSDLTVLKVVFGLTFVFKHCAARTSVEEIHKEIRPEGPK